MDNILVSGQPLYKQPGRSELEEEQMGLKHFFNQIKIALSFADIVITFEDGQAKTNRGKPRPSLLTALSEIAASNNIKTGLILARRQGPGHQLTISRDIPETLHQRIRNVWGANAR